MMRSLMVVVALVLILMALKADADAILEVEREPKGQLLNQTAFGRKARAGGNNNKDAEEIGESKKSSVSVGNMMLDSENGGSGANNIKNYTDNNSGNNSTLHPDNHHYFTDPRKLPPRY